MFLTVRFGGTCPYSIRPCMIAPRRYRSTRRSEEHTSELQSQSNLVCRLLLEKKKIKRIKLKLVAHKPLNFQRLRTVKSIACVPLAVYKKDAWSLDAALKYLPQLHIKSCDLPL